MKVKLALVLTLLITAISFAQNGINYKAVIKDNNGNVVANQTIDIQFTIQQGATNVYQEIHSPTTDNNGFVMVNIGEETPVLGTFSAINWSGEAHFLNVQIDIEQDATFVDMGTTEFKAVPYALNAASKIDDLTDGKSDNDGTSIFLGINAGLNDDGTNNSNIAVGFEALQSNTTGQKNIAMGNESLKNNTVGEANTSNGYQSLFQNSTGSWNTANGYISLKNNTTGTFNTALGSTVLWNNTEGNQNTASGYRAFYSNTTGSDNVGIGIRSGFSNTVGNGNVFIGSHSGYNETTSNKLYIENSASDANNALIYGEFDTNILRTNSQFQIGNPALTGFAFPLTDGVSNQILQTDGNGALTWVDNLSSVASGLEAIDEGNGIGYRLSGANPIYYGNIGDRAVDLSYGGDADYDAGQGAVGTGSVAMGQYTTANVGSVAMGYGTSATGQYATAMGSNTTASGPFAVAMGEASTASGISATAIGYNTEASGQASTAMGLETEASGENSTALGDSTNAIGENSLAAGELTIAAGKTSTAIGNGINANGLLTTAIGRFNLGGGDPTNWVETDPLFEIGNGSGFGAKSNALTVLKNGTIIAPGFDITEITDNKALITKEYADANYSGGGSGSNPTGLEALNEGNGIGWRLIGRDINNYGNIGLNSIDLSFSEISSTTNGATGYYSFAFGRRAIASGESSTSLGVLTNASGNFSTALGRETIASSDYSTAMGRETIASSDVSTALGYGSEASGSTSTAMGSFTVASGIYSTALGETTTASSRSTTAMGRGTIADDIFSTVVGKFNDNTTSTTSLFQVGNGGSTSTRSNAFNIDSNGTITAPSFDISEITDDKALITKEYLDANGATGLEALDEGNGVGWRLKGRDPAFYDNIGENAIDLSISNSNSVILGASGFGSLAVGIGVEASGNYSFAQGGSTQAPGLYAVALGYATVANGAQSIAMGGFSSASATFSAALGRSTIADDNNSTVVGAYNDNTTSTSTLFQVGNGTTNSNRSNALTVYQNGNIEMGNNTSASGFTSTAMGGLSNAIGNYSTAMGSNTTASGLASTAMGINTEASNSYSTAMGSNSLASGSTATAMGTGTQALGTSSTAIGNQAIASGNVSFATGELTLASAYLSTAMGRSTISDDVYTTVIGKYNDNTSSTTTLFQIGNGTATTNRSNAFTVYQSGNALLAGTLTQSSDRRLKKDIEDLNYGLNEILALSPKAYHWKNREQNYKSLGLIAQEVQPVIKELVHVSEDENKTLSVSYTELIPVLIKAIQEQQVIIDAQKNTISTQSKALESLLDRVEALEKKDKALVITN